MFLQARARDPIGAAAPLFIEEQTNQPTAAGRRGGTLRVALNNDPNSLDPMTSRTGHEVMPNVFEPLVRLDEQVRVVPWLARSFEQPDPLTCLFHLREDVRLHDGAALDAEAVRFSIDRVRSYKPGPNYPDTKPIDRSVARDRLTYQLIARAAVREQGAGAAAVG